jgi:hypothetical protein
MAKLIFRTMACWDDDWVFFETRLCGSSPKNDKLVPASGRCTCTELAIESSESRQSRYTFKKKVLE